MKKLILLILAVALVFVAVVACTHSPAAPAPTAAPAEDPAPAVTVEPVPGQTAAEQTPSPVPERVDLAALHELYPADDVYATVGEREITWGEYYEWLGTYILSAESYMDSMAYYGMALGWDSEYTGDATMADYVIAGLNDNLRAFAGVDLFAGQNGVSVTDEEIEAKRSEQLAATLGEDFSEEDAAELLLSNFTTDTIFRAQCKAQLELTRVQAEKYGENGEKLGVPALQRFIEDQGYLHCNHILLATIDLTTREALDEAAAAEKKALAEQLAAELQAIEDRDELLARFAELKEQYCEDSGKAYYPDGYLFTPGTMVAVFEDTTASLKDYEVSAPVLSEYGYHIILRLPISGDSVLDNGGTVAQAAVSACMAEELDAVVDALELKLAPGKEPVNLLAFLVGAVEK